MKIHLSLIHDDPSWKIHSAIDNKLCNKIVLKTLSFFPITHTQHIELSILLTNNPRMQELNTQFLNKNKPTNVLAFPDQTLHRYDILKSGLPTTAIYLGDIAIGYDILKQESVENKISLENHFIHLIIHAILHLLGFDHDTNDKTLEMQKIEVQILQLFDIPSPYVQ